MRTALLAVLFLSASTTSAADPALPPIVFQTQPLGRILDDLRAGADIVGGEKGIQALNRGLKQLLGEKGFEGLDINRPLVGYVVLAPKPEDITAVIAFPITDEKEFLALCDRVNKDKLRVDDKDKTLYHMPPLEPQYKALMRFKDRYAYIAYGANPAPHIAPAALVPMEKLFDAAERGLIAARIHFERIPLPVKLVAGKLLAEVKKTLFSSGRPGGFGVGKQEMALLEPALAELEKLLDRYLRLAPGADSLAARLILDAASGSLVLEAALVPKPNTELARTIAAFRLSANKFAALAAHPDTVGAFTFRVPLFEEELRNAAVLALEAGQKEALKNTPPVRQATTEELFKGLIRTVKTGEFDLALTVRGPDKNGWFTLVGAVAFDDPSKLEKEIRAYVEKDAEKEVADAIKWDVAKAGAVGIHTWKPTPGGFIDPSKVFGGEDCMIAFAFAPQGILGAMGPDAVGTVKEALAVKPAAAPVLQVLLNPARTTKLIHKIMGPDDPDIADVETVLGNEDKLLSIFAATLDGGKELRAAITINLKVLPRALLYRAIQRGGEEKNVVPPKPVGK
jgi:hypothetical protein